jgi:hypothetical protein
LLTLTETLATARRELLSGTVKSVGLDLEHLPDNFDGQSPLCRQPFLHDALVSSSDVLDPLSGLHDLPCFCQTLQLAISVRLPSALFSTSCVDLHFVVFCRENAPLSSTYKNSKSSRTCFFHFLPPSSISSFYLLPGYASHRHMQHITMILSQGHGRGAAFGLHRPRHRQTRSVTCVLLWLMGCVWPLLLVITLMSLIGMGFEADMKKLAGDFPEVITPFVSSLLLLLLLSCLIFTPAVNSFPSLLSFFASNLLSPLPPSNQAPCFRCQIESYCELNGLINVLPPELWAPITSIPVVEAAPAAAAAGKGKGKGTGKGKGGKGKKKESGLSKIVRSCLGHFISKQLQVRSLSSYCASPHCSCSHPLFYMRSLTPLSRYRIGLDGP